MQLTTVPVWHAIGPEPCHRVAFRLRERPPAGLHSLYALEAWGRDRDEPLNCCGACGKLLSVFEVGITLRTG